MKLEDLKQSITLLSNDEAIEIHREVRVKRMTVGNTTKKNTKTTSEKRESKTKKEVKGDPEKIRALLKLLGEDTQ